MAENTGKNQSGEDIIPLDKLVGDAAGAKAESVTASPATEPAAEPPPQAPAEAAPPKPDAPTAAAIPIPTTAEVPPVDMVAVDQGLDLETPGFTEGLNDLKELKAEDEHVPAPDPVVEKLVEQGRSGGRKGLRGLLFRVLYIFNVLGAYALVVLSRLSHGLVALAKLVKKLSIEGLHAAKAGATRVGAAIKSFLALPMKTKLLSIFAVVVLAVFVFVLKLTVVGTRLPKIEIPLLRSFGDVADAKYTIEDDEAWEDFNDPLFHPEHVVAIDRVVANLLPPGDGRNPMILMDLFIEAANKDGAIEVKVREAEVRDVIGRTVEQMSYEELVTPAGKTKLKVLLRQKLNEFLTEGRVRRVLLKSLVLKP